jgi:hypothetical protein
MSKVWKKLSRILASMFSIMPKKLILLFLLPNENDKIKQIMRHCQTRLGTTIYPKYYLSMFIQIHFSFKLLNKYKVISSFLLKLVISNFFFFRNEFLSERKFIQRMKSLLGYSKAIFKKKIKKGWASDRIATSIGDNSKIHIKQ